MGFSGSYDELRQKVHMNTNLLSGFEKMKKEISDKEKFLQQTGLSEVSRTSFYADQLALDLPLAIQLIQLNIHPPVKKYAADAETMNFTPDVIHISGITAQSAELNEWINIIREKDWVRNVSILSYTQDAFKKTGEFSIEATIK